MSKVLVISSDQRALSLIEQFRTFLRTQIIVARDINQGLKLFFDKRPAVVFIQDELSGTSAETVAGHIKTLLLEESPRIILLRSSGTHCRVSPYCFDDFITLSLAEHVLLAKFSELLKKMPEIQWKNDGTAEEDLRMTGENTERADVADTEVDPGLDDELPEDFLSNSSDLPVCAGQPQDAFPDENNVMPMTFEDIGPKKACPAAGEQMDNCSAPKSDMILLCGLGIACLAALVFGGYHVGTSISATNVPAYIRHVVPGESQTAEEAAAQVSGRFQTIRLPASISQGSSDPVYASGHPGWERYFADKREYLVYREKGTVRAIQVIALDKGMISEDFCMRFIKDVTNGEFPIRQSTREKDGFLIEEGKAGDTTEVLIYRKKTSEEIRAFVVAF